MKTILSLILTTVISHLCFAQLDSTKENSTSLKKAFYVMPHSGIAKHFTTSSEPAWQLYQFRDPENHTGWNSYLDGLTLFDQDVDYSFDFSGNFGLEMGIALLPTDGSNSIVYIGLGIEYQERSLSSVQQYHNGELLGRIDFSESEARVKYGLNIHAIHNTMGFSLGFWYRRSTFPERSIQFSSYRDGQLVHREELYPSAGSSDPMDYAQYWKESSGGIGMSLGFLYQPVDYLRVFIRYEFTHMSATYREGNTLSTLFERNGVNVHSVMLGLAFPLVYNY